MSTFGRLLQGQADEIVGFEQSSITLDDPQVVAISGKAQHVIVKFNGRNDSRVAGTVFEAAVVFDAQGQIQGYQTKNQIDPTEDQFYVPGNTRQIFEINGVKFGVAICHEGWRYPETVRWAAARGAKIVFHPQHTGTEREGVRLTEWGAARNPYYEKAMMMRSRENTIYFASVNYALRFQESATSLITPSGECRAYLPYGQEGVLVQEINVEEATGLLAARYAPERYQEFKLE